MNDATDESMKLTHIVAVIGYVYRDGKFLLLKRNNPPLLWAPPGGRLNKNEDPKNGVIREVREETGLDVSVLQTADTWFGEIQPGKFMLAIDYLVKITGGTLRLSDEHSDFAWVSVDDIRQAKGVDLGDPKVGFKADDFAAAEQLIFKLNNT